jgi:hypothetical protein
MYTTKGVKEPLCNHFKNPHQGYHPCRCGNHCKHNPDPALAAGYCNHPGIREGVQHVFGKITKEQYAFICIMGCYFYDGPARKFGW